MHYFLIKIFSWLYVISAISPIAIIFLLRLQHYVWAISIFLFALIYSNIFLKCCSKNFGDERAECDLVEIAEPKFVPMYIAYFVIALSIDDGNLCLFLIIFSGIFILIQRCKFSFFNPFVLFGFNFYEVSIKNNTGTNYKIFLISRQNIKNINELSNLIRLNDFTFLEKGRDE